MGRAGGDELDSHLGKMQDPRSSLPSSFSRGRGRGRWGRGGRAKQEQVGTGDGVFAEEPFASNFLSLPELIGQLFQEDTRVSHGKFHPACASVHRCSSPVLSNAITVFLDKDKWVKPPAPGTGDGSDRSQSSRQTSWSRANQQLSSKWAHVRKEIPKPNKHRSAL